MKVLYLSIIVVFSFACSSVEEKKALISVDFDKLTEIERLIQQDITDWGMQSEVEASVVNDTLKVVILYKKISGLKEGQIPYYYDEYSNELIVRLLAVKHKDLLGQQPILYIKLRFEGAYDVGHFYIDKFKYMLYEAFFQNKLLHENVVYSLSNFTPREILFLETLIEIIVLKKWEYKINYNYWQLLAEFSDYLLLRNSENFDGAKLFVYMVSNNKRIKHNEFSENCNEKLLWILKNSGLDERVYDLETTPEIEEYLMGIERIPLPRQ